MSGLLLPKYARAPFIAPGRRNRRVYWDRALAKQIESLGKFEKEDWRAGRWLPKSVRGWAPKWAHYPCPDCCGGFAGDCVTAPDCFPDTVDTEVEVELPFFEASPAYCADLEATYILTWQLIPTPEVVYIDADYFGTGNALIVQITFACSSNQCVPTVFVCYNNVGNYRAFYGGVVPITSFPHSLPYSVSSGFFPCDIPTDPVIINSISGWTI